MPNLKIDLPDLYVSEVQKFRELKELGASRTTTGTISFTSNSSGATYNSITGQLGIMQQLDSILTQYKINASDWNDAENAFVNHVADYTTFKSNTNTFISDKTFLDLRGCRYLG